MTTEKVTFTNPDGQQLAARLALPPNQHPIAYAIFAHCFTCSKNLTAVRNVSRGLTDNGIAVLRFDFTGLGESEGDFADTNFSSNLQDLLAAAEFLKQHDQAPSILVGHSLGGTAVMMAAAQLDSVQAITTIGSPADPAHVKHLLQDELDQIKQTGKARVNIGGRDFTIKKQFLDDIEAQSPLEALKNIRRKAWLFMHSPQDKIVEIDNALALYKAAHHPKSFVSLDGSDHLLSNKQDSYYTGEVISTWVKRYLDLKAPEKLQSPKEVVARLRQADTFTTDIQIGEHHLRADEPESVGGNNFGASPYELVASGLGACTAMTLRMYANRKKWDLQEVRVHLSHLKDYHQDAKYPDDPKRKMDIFERHIEVIGKLDEQQVQRLKEIANKCPVHKTLESQAIVQTSIEKL